jgi:hypothetical protein
MMLESGPIRLATKFIAKIVVREKLPVEPRYTFGPYDFLKYTIEMWQKNSL